MSNRFTSRLTDNDDFKRDELIRKIEHAVEHMTLSELEALSYDMFTKGYITDYKGRIKKSRCFSKNIGTFLSFPRDFFKSTIVRCFWGCPYSVGSYNLNL